MKQTIILKEKEYYYLIDQCAQESSTISKQVEYVQTILNDKSQTTSASLFVVQSEITKIKTEIESIRSKLSECEESLAKSQSVSKAKGKVQDTIVNTSPQTISLKDFNFEAELSDYKSQVEETIKSIKKEVVEIVIDYIKPIEDRIMNSKLSFEKITLELKEKLSWLPMNLSELSGMNPSAARLFTIEARLRAEENSRIQALNNLEKSLDIIRKNSMSPICFKNSVRKATPDHYSSDLIHKTESIDKSKNKLSVMEGIIYESADNRRTRRKLRGFNSVDKTFRRF
jgi:hypothetical protein